MNATRPLALLFASALAACGGTERESATTAAATAGVKPTMPPPPSARRVDQVDHYHGVQVADPYRWMEDLDAPELAAWIAQQNAYTEQYLADAPGRAHIKQRLEALWNYDRYANDRGGLVPIRRGERYFYSRNDGLQNQFVIYAQDGLDGEPRAVLDPNALSADGTLSLGEFAVTRDGKLLAYSISDGGSDWRTIKIRDVDSGKDLADEVRWAKFTNIAWHRDGSGFFYSRFDTPQGENELKAVNKFQKVYFHRLGTAQDADQLVYERQDQPDWGFSATVSDDGRYLIIAVSLGTDTRNLLFYKDLSAKSRNAPVVELIGDFRAEYEFIGNVGNAMYLRTDDEAERYRVIRIDLTQPAREHWQTVVPQRDATITQVAMIHNQLLVNSLTDAHSQVDVFSLDGKATGTLSLPGLGTVHGLTSSNEAQESFFAYSDFVTPWSLYRYDSQAGSIAAFRQPKLNFDASAYETLQVTYISKDGTKVPMFIVGKKGYARDGNNPTMLYGYGGFNISVTPTFNASTISWLELGGLYAVANLRGGGEYGRAWHEAGTKVHKQNVFDDFISAAEYLIAERYTTPKRLAIYGRSNGGLLVGATMLQRPDLFGAALPAVGVLDMLRFRDFTIGWAWESDYGSVLNADEFKALYAYSPLHNVRSGQPYPPTLITTADRDDRVFPAHSFKFAAALQSSYHGSNPMLIRVETRAGHGAGKPTSKIIEETADMYAFLCKTLKISVPATAPASPTQPDAP